MFMWKWCQCDIHVDHVETCLQFSSRCCASVCKTETEVKLMKRTSDCTSHTALTVHNVKAVNMDTGIFYDMFCGDTFSAQVSTGKLCLHSRLRSSLVVFVNVKLTKCLIFVAM